MLWTTYTAPELDDLLVPQRGWTTVAYREFLFHGRSGQLLEPG